MPFLALLTTIILPVSCGNENQKITVEEVRTALDDLFIAVDENPNDFRELVTEDFIIFENSRRYNTEEFIEFISGFDMVKKERTFKNIKIDTDINSAHITLNHHGEFIINTPEGKQKLVFDWLESVYLIKEKEKLKFKFYFSEAIKNTSIPFVDISSDEDIKSKASKLKSGASSNEFIEIEKHNPINSEITKNTMSILKSSLNEDIDCPECYGTLQPTYKTEYCYGIRCRDRTLYECDLRREHAYWVYIN